MQHEYVARLREISKRANRKAWAVFSNTIDLMHVGHWLTKDSTNTNGQRRFAEAIAGHNNKHTRGAWRAWSAQVLVLTCWCSRRLARHGHQPCCAVQPAGSTRTPFWCLACRDRGMERDLFSSTWPAGKIDLQRSRNRDMRWMHMRCPGMLQ